MKIVKKSEASYEGDSCPVCHEHKSACKGTDNCFKAAGVTKEAQGRSVMDYLQAIVGATLTSRGMSETQRLDEIRLLAKDAIATLEGRM